MARLTRLLIGINVAVFALEAVSGPGFLARFALWPVGHFIVAQFDGPVGFRLWQLMTCGFLHANLLHLAINMYALWMFGSDVERAVGPRHYLIRTGFRVPGGAMARSLGAVKVMYLEPCVRRCRRSGGTVFLSRSRGSRKHLF
jgi:hypothetical protein